MLNEELNDIRFEFVIGKDKADGIACELVAAGLVDPKDVSTIASNLQRLVDSQSQTTKDTSITFPLNSAIAPNETPSDVALIGYAAITIVD
uniref:non-specific serine/threonine protein kinase n=1 Tax=Triatoma infestans TaxID=30076 RepID=A0A161MP84_TRIIF